MSKTKQEVVAFLDTLVGTMVINKTDRRYDGQCVTLIKALMEFLGVANPYAARGDAKDAGNTYIREGLATKGRGWLTVVVNADMGLINGVKYGHIWIDLENEANYEQNGNKALKTTKNTRPITQGLQFINFDQWLEGSDMKITREQIKWHYRTIAGVDPTEQEIKNYDGKDYAWVTEEIKRYFANNNGDAWAWRNKAEELGAQVTQLQAKLKGAPVSSSKDSESLRKIREGLGLQ